MDAAEFTSQESVKSVLYNEYGLEITTITKMDSYSNVNYLISCPTLHETNLVVKIFDQNVSSFFDNSQLQHALMLYLCDNGLKCSIPFQTKSGATYVRCIRDKSDYLLQVLSFVPGVPINSLKQDHNDFEKICYLTGENLAKLHLIGENLDFEFETKDYDFRWLPHNAHKCLEHLPDVKDPKIVGQIVNHMGLYERIFLPALKYLRRGFIHGDFSDCNVIVKETGGEWQFAGVIDFEHCHLGYLVGDLGISIAYLLTKAASIGYDPIRAASAQIRGYQSNIVLDKQEKLVLVDAIMSRLCVSYLCGSHEASLHPENSDFIFLQSKQIPSLFDKFDEMGRDRLLELLF